MRGIKNKPENSEEFNVKRKLSPVGLGVRIILIVGIIMLSVNIVKTLAGISSQKETINKTHNRLIEEQEKAKALKEEEENFNKDAEVERRARETFGLVKVGEKKVIIEEKE